MHGVPIPSNVLPFLQEYCRCLNRSRPFCTAGKDIMTKSSYVKLWAGIRQKMESPDLTAHIFRHNYCTNLCYQIPTVSIKKIAELLGDNEKMVIEVYNHIILDKEDAQKAVELALNA
nr:site-specific integrase [uncultured Acetatifactor sp.]